MAETKNKTSNEDKKDILYNAEKLSNDLITKALLYSIENVKKEKNTKK